MTKSAIGKGGARNVDGIGGVDGGIYEAEIVIESISPMTFVIN